MQRQGRNSLETIVPPWGRVLVPPQGLHIAVSLSCFADTETTSRWEKLRHAAHRLGGPTPVEFRLRILTPTYLTTDQSEEGPRADHALSEPFL